MPHSAKGKMSLVVGKKEIERERRRGVATCRWQRKCRFQLTFELAQQRWRWPS